MKTKTHVERSANEVLQTITSICDVANISRDERNDLLFENGCRLVEAYVEDADIRNDLLQNEYFGFWAWWVTEFAYDDKMMLMCYKNAGLPPGFRYSVDKEYMICSSSLRDRFQNFINRLIKRLQHEKV